MHYNVLQVGQSIRVESFRGQESGKVFVTETGLSKVDHGGAVSGLNQIDLTQKSESRFQAVACAVNREGGVDISKASDLNQHVKRTFRCDY